MMMLSFGKNGTIYVMQVLGKFRRAEKKTRWIVIIDCDGDVDVEEARKGFEYWLRGFRFHLLLENQERRTWTNKAFPRKCKKYIARSILTFLYVGYILSRTREGDRGTELCPLNLFVAYYCGESLTARKIL